MTSYSRTRQTDKRIFCDDKNFHIFFKDAVKFIFNLDHEDSDAVTYTAILAISDSNSAEEFVYSKECDEIIKFESNNNGNIEPRNAHDIILFFEKFAELIICS